MPMPKQKPGKSRGDYQTPTMFLEALKRRLGIEDFRMDLAASSGTNVAPVYYAEEENSLIQNWSRLGGWVFCNPPFGDISPWVVKAYMQSIQGAKVAMLVPASVGANWWRDSVDGKAHVLFLNGRLTFVGEKGPYPKDCAILLYTPFIRGGYSVWDWA